MTNIEKPEKFQNWGRKGNFKRIFEIEMSITEPKNCLEINQKLFEKIVFYGVEKIVFYLMFEKIVFYK